MTYNEELYHYGIKGQKWGVRRYQNSDRTSTPSAKTQLTAALTAIETVRSAKTNANRYAKVLNDNALIAVNRISQMSLSIGLSRAAAAVATKRGKKVTANVLKAIGNLTATGFGAEMVAELAMNTTNRGD